MVFVIQFSTISLIQHCLFFWAVSPASREPLPQLFPRTWFFRLGTNTRLGWFHGLFLYFFGWLHYFCSLVNFFCRACWSVKIHYLFFPTLCGSNCATPLSCRFYTLLVCFHDHTFCLLLAFCLSLARLCGALSSTVSYFFSSFVILSLKSNILWAIINRHLFNSFSFSLSIFILVFLAASLSVLCHGS